jgi:membrane protease YdiL (CAAX protease family)
MYDIHSRPGSSYRQGLIILLALVGAGLVVGSLISGGVWTLMTGRSIFTMQEDMNDPAYLNAMRVMQLVATLFVFFIPAVITAMVLNKKPYRFLGFNFWFSRKQVIMTMLIMLAALPLVGALGELNKMIPLTKSLTEKFQQLEDTYADQVKILANIKTPADFLLSLLVMAVAPAIFEETMFRGGLQNLLQKLMKNPWLAIGITSILFSAIHISFYGFLPRVALGVVLGLLFYYSGSIWLCILGHFFNNALVVTQIYVYQRQGKSVEEAMNETFPIWYGILGLAALYFLFRFFRRNAEQDRKTLVPQEQVAVEDQWMT